MEILTMKPDLHRSSKGPRSRGRVPVLRLLAVLVGLAVWLEAAMPSQAREYSVKAVYLLNFTRFGEWPSRAVEDARAPFVVGLVGHKPEAVAAISAVLKGKTTDAGRTLEVRVFDGVTSATGSCHLLYLGGSSPPDWPVVNAIVGDRPVMLVGESEAFAQTGGMINFILADDAVRFELNPWRAARAGIKLSGSLASVARLVRDKENADK